MHDASHAAAFLDFPPPATALARVDSALREEGYAVLAADSVRMLAGCDAQALARLQRDWDDLPPDQYLRDGGRYRHRRHASYVAEAAALRKVAHRAHWQSTDYNALHGGMARWFEPIAPATEAAAAWHALLLAIAGVADRLRGPRPWFVEAHQFRIDTTDGIGRPTPEGAHRDGVDLVAVFLLARHAIKGGETRVFEADGPRGLRFTLREPWSLMLLDDHRMIHELSLIHI